MYYNVSLPCRHGFKRMYGFNSDVVVLCSKFYIYIYINKVFNRKRVLIVFMQLKGCFIPLYYLLHK